MYQAQMQQPQYPYAARQPSYPPQGGYGAPGGYGMQAAPSGPTRNVALLVSGILGLAIGALAFLPFAYNVYQYVTIDDHFADMSAETRDFIVPLLEHAAIHRMILFGSISSIFGLAGLVLAGIGFQKK